VYSEQPQVIDFHWRTNLISLKIPEATMMVMARRFLITTVAIAFVRQVLGNAAVDVPISQRSSIRFSANSAAGRSLLAQSRELNNNNNNNNNNNDNSKYFDSDFVSGYSVKFQGCHHVQQWNNEANDESEVRIKTKRLVRYRLCPYESCSSTKSAGCTSKYGDYVVDMNTFVDSYLEAMEEEKGEICQEAASECDQQCNGGEDSSCMQACYKGFELSVCLNDDAGNKQFNVQEYVDCAKYNFGGRRLDNNDNIQYYIGPYCAAQGGEIHLGLFTDDTCTTAAQNGDSKFYSANGYNLPYSSSSIISTRCMSCGTTDSYGATSVSDFCQNIYSLSGKCETKMSIDYPNESACSYVEGIKIIREDGVIRTSTTKKSKAAAVCIGMFLTVAVLLAGYVYYLRTSKLYRSLYDC
jgi:hypothetical protein